MKIIYERPTPCPCYDKLTTFERLTAGSIVECDCGQQWIMSESQRDGKFWVKHTPLKQATCR